jgi:hypothetical protein
MSQESQAEMKGGPLFVAAKAKLWNYADKVKSRGFTHPVSKNTGTEKVLQEVVEFLHGEIQHFNGWTQLNALAVCQFLTLVGREALVIHSGTVGGVHVNNLVKIFACAFDKIGMKFGNCRVGQYNVIVPRTPNANHIRGGTPSPLLDFEYKGFGDLSRGFGREACLLVAALLNCHSLELKGGLFSPSQVFRR